MDEDVETSKQQNDLAGRITRGDRSAEAELVHRYGPRLEFILHRHVREPSLAADLRQEALIVVIQRLRSEALEDPEKLAAFVHRTAINLARGEARTYYRRNTHPDSEGIENVVADEPMVADQIDKMQLAEIIRQLLRELRQPRDRQILRRFYLAEESKTSVCASLQVTPEHFDRVLHRARKRFRKILEARFGKFGQGQFRRTR